MNASTAMFLGTLLGLLIAAVLMLKTLMQYVSTDMEAFRKWLDGQGMPA